MNFRFKKWFGALALVFCVAVSSGQRNVFADVSQITRTVILPDGQPAVGAKVSLHLREKDGRWKQVQTQTDAQGIYRAEVAHERGQPGYLFVEAPNCALGFARLGEDAFFALSQKPVAAPLRLSPDYTVRGKVVDALNRPVVGAQVAFTAVPHVLFDMCGNMVFWEHLEVEGVMPSQSTTRSQADGTFALRGISYNEAGVPLPVISGAKVGADVGVPLPIEAHKLADENNAQPFLAGVAWLPFSANGNLLRVPSAAPLTFTLQPTTHISGRAINAVTGQTVPDAKLYPGFRTFPRLPQTNLDGEFECEALLSQRELTSYSPSESLFYTSSPGFATTRTKIEELRDINPAPQSINKVEIKLWPKATLSGKVVVSDTGEIPLVPISIRTQWQDKTDDSDAYVPSDYARTAPNGQFSIELVAGHNSFQVGAHSPQPTQPQDAYASQETISLAVPPEGLQGIIFKVDKRPGCLLHFKTPAAKTEDPLQAIGRYTLEARGGIRGLYYGGFSEFMFFPTEHWGDEMEIRVLRDGGDHEEVLAWTKIAANPKTWPLEIALP